MSLADHAIFWHVYALGACGAPERLEDLAPVPRIRRLHAWLPYMVELGCNALLLGPVSTSTSHGYDTIDHLGVDPRLGTVEDVQAVIDDARGRGIQVVLDGVFNHVGDQHPLWQQAKAQGPDGELAGMFRWSGEYGYGFEGNADLITLNHADPRVEDLVVEAMLFWLDRGVSGWRLDAAFAVDPAFWARVLPRVRTRHPDAWFVGEMIHSGYAEYVAASTLDSVTQYELWKATWSSIKEHNFFELDWNLKRHAEFMETMLPMTFLGNHDQTRIASQLGDEGALIAATALLTLPGVPSIYYGDEQGFRGTKYERAGGDVEMRAPLPETPEGLAPWGWWLYRAHQDLIALRRRNPWLVRGTVEVQELENERFVYDVVGSGDGERLTVTLDVTDGAVATVRQGDQEVFASAARNGQG